MPSFKPQRAEPVEKPQSVRKPRTKRQIDFRSTNVSKPKPVVEKQEPSEDEGDDWEGSSLSKSSASNISNLDGEEIDEIEHQELKQHKEKEITVIDIYDQQEEIDLKRQKAEAERQERLRREAEL